MAKALTIEWLDAAAASKAAPARAPFARVLICDLHDPALAPFRAVAPHAGDLSDAHYPGASGRSHFIERRVMLRAFAARCAGAAPDAVRIFYDEHGAPRVGGADVFVSVSSRGGRIALAVASSPVGVDLERVEQAGPVIEDVLGKRERQTLERLSGDARARGAERRIKRLRIDGHCVCARVGRRRLVQKPLRASVRKSASNCKSVSLGKSAKLGRRGRGAPIPIAGRGGAPAGAHERLCGVARGYGAQAIYARRRAAVHRARQRFLQSAHDKPAHEAGIAKAHFGFRRMHVHVYFARIKIKIQRKRRMTITGQIIHVGAAHGAMQQLVAHGPSVDEEILLQRIGAMPCRQACKTRKAHAFAQRIHAQ